MSLVHLHLLMNHIPVIGVLFVAVVLIAALRTRSSDMGKLALILLVGVAMVSAIVYFTGEPAEDAVEHLTGVSRATIHEHEEAAEIAFIAVALSGVAALGALLLYRRLVLPPRVSAAGLVVALLLSGLMAWTANLGGAIRHSEIRISALADSTAGRSGRERDEH